MSPTRKSASFSKTICNFDINPKTLRGISERKLQKISLSCDHQKVLKSWYIGLTEGGEEARRRRRNPFQVTFWPISNSYKIQTNLNFDTRQSIHKHMNHKNLAECKPRIKMRKMVHKRMKQNNLAECKLRIEMEKMADNGAGIPALLTALKFYLEGAAAARQRCVPLETHCRVASEPLCLVNCLLQCMLYTLVITFRACKQPYMYAYNILQPVCYHKYVVDKPLSI